MLLLLLQMHPLLHLHLLHSKRALTAVSLPVSGQTVTASGSILVHE